MMHRQCESWAVVASIACATLLQVLWLEQAAAGAGRCVAHAKVGSALRFMLTGP